MKIILIQPKMNKRPMDTNLKTRMSPSLALLTLLRLTPDIHEVTIINENIEKINYDIEADLVGITVTLDVLPRAISIANKYKIKKIPIVAGGIHVTCDPDGCFEHFDAICIGAAERVWSRIIEDAQIGQLKHIYHDMKEFKGSEIASPLFKGIQTKKYLYNNVITTSRGCPNRCDFCYNSCKNRTYVLRPIEDVLKDIDELQTRHVLFIDDNFIGSPKYCEELLNKMKNKSLIWSAAVTTKILEFPKLLDLMKETGCQSLFIGFESINDSSLQTVNKDNHFEIYDQLVEAIHSRGIMINASMVFGLDGDTKAVFKQTMDWLVKNRIETLTSHILTPYPGTQLYKKMLEENRITDFDLSKYNTSHVVFKPKNMSEKELYSGYLWMYKKFYSFSNIIKRMPKDKTQRRPYLLFNLFYRKFGRFTSFIAHFLPLKMLGKFAAKIAYKVR